MSGARRMGCGPAGSAPNEIARKFIGGFRIAANCGEAALNRPSVSCCRRDRVPRNAMQSAIPRRAEFSSRAFPASWMMMAGGRPMPSDSARHNATARGIEPGIDPFRPGAPNCGQLTAVASHQSVRFSQLTAIRQKGFQFVKETIECWLIF